MIYIYDILLNFCDCDTIYDFYEWNQSDTIENIKRIKLVHVKRDILDTLLSYNAKVDSEFLLKIFKTCEVYTSKKVRIMDYCCLFSDGNRVLAVEFNNDGIPIYKSKLLIDEEEEIAVLASNLELYPLNLKRGEKILENRFFTRNEIVIRKYLMREIDECYHKKNYEKLRYLYEEYFEDESSSYQKMYHELISSMKDDLNQKHFNIYQLLRLTVKKKQV